MLTSLNRLKQRLYRRLQINIKLTDNRAGGAKVISGNGLVSSGRAGTHPLHRQTIHFILVVRGELVTTGTDFRVLVVPFDLWLWTTFGAHLILEGVVLGGLFLWLQVLGDHGRELNGQLTGAADLAKLVYCHDFVNSRVLFGG